MGPIRPRHVSTSLCLAACLLLAHGAEAGRNRNVALMADSPHRELVPPPGPCDVVITQVNQDTTIPMLDDPDKRVFCVDPGNYRRQLHPKIQSSGTANARRYLRFNEPFPATPAIYQSQRAVFHGLVFSGASYWVVEGITIQPVAPQNYTYLVAIFGGSHNVLEGNFIDASHQPNTTQQKGIVLGSNLPNIPSTYNTIQGNVIRGGNLSNLGMDYTGVSVPVEHEAGAANSFNKILDNEIYNWGDGIQISAASADCASFVAWPKGTLIDGNDIYIRKSKYVDCSDGTPDPAGGCACAENGIDVKTPAGSNPSRWTQITNNRLWGFRPTLRDVPSCGGSGARGAAITAGNACAAHVLVASNVITDSTQGVFTEGSDWTVAGNLLSEMRTVDPDNGNRGVALYPLATSTRVQFNTVVGVDNSYEDTGSNIVTQCNAVIHDAGQNGAGGPRGSNHTVKYNHVYESFSPNLDHATTQIHPEDTDSRNAAYCYLRRRFTGPDEVCIPFGLTTASSPHADLPNACSADLGAAFGLPGLGFP